MRDSERNKREERERENERMKGNTAERERERERERARERESGARCARTQDKLLSRCLEAAQGRNCLDDTGKHPKGLKNTKNKVLSSKHAIESKK